MASNKVKRVLDLNISFSVGEQLIDWMAELEWDINKLSEETGIAVDTLNAIIEQDMEITEEIAQGIGKAFYSPGFWLRAYHNHKEFRQHCNND